MSVRRSSSRKGKKSKNRAISRSVSRPSTVLGLQRKLLDDEPDDYENMMRDPRMRAIIKSPAFHQWYHSRKPYNNPSEGGFKKLTMSNVIRAFEIDSELSAPSEETISAWEAGKVNRVDMIGAFKYHGKGEYLHEDPKKGVMRLTTKSGFGIDLNPMLEIANSKPFREKFDIEDREVIYADYEDYYDSLGKKKRKQIDTKIEELDDDEFLEWFDDKHGHVRMMDELLKVKEVNDFFDISKDLKIVNSGDFKRKFDLAGFTIHENLVEYTNSLSEKRQKEIIDKNNKLSESKFGDWIEEYVDKHKIAFLDSLLDEDGVEAFIDNRKNKSDGLKIAGRRNAEGKYPFGSFAYDIANANTKKIKRMKSQDYLDQYETYELKRLRQALAGTDKADDPKTKIIEVGGLIKHRKEKTEGQKISPTTVQLRELLSVVDKEIFDRTIYNQTSSDWRTITDPNGYRAKYKRTVRYAINEDGMSDEKMKYHGLHNLTEDQVDAYMKARDEDWKYSQPRATMTIIRGYQKEVGSTLHFHDVSENHFKVLRSRKAKKSEPKKTSKKKIIKKDKAPIEVKVPKNFEKLVEVDAGEFGFDDL